MNFTLASLTDSALRGFSTFLDTVGSDSTEEPPYHLLQGEENVNPIQLSDGFVDVDQDTAISTRMDIGRYLSNLITTREDLATVLDDKGAGAFLALVYFERICTKNSDGTWNIKAKDRYIPNLENRQRFYRHLVFSPLSVYKLHQEKARLYLCQPSHRHPDTMEQIGSREELILNSAIIELADILYWDEDNADVKVGAVSYDPIPDGAMRRFVGPGSFTEQYGTVYDFWSMDADAISRLLPRPEFDAWLE